MSRRAVIACACVLILAGNRPEAFVEIERLDARIAPSALIARMDRAARNDLALSATPSPADTEALKAEAVFRVEPGAD